jgi:hypothetical protein
MRYRRYERGESLPGSIGIRRTGPIGFVWFGMQGICLIGVFLLWPSLTLYINQAQWWAWVIFPPVQILNWIFWGYIWKGMMDDAQGNTKVRPVRPRGQRVYGKDNMLLP